VGDRHLAFELPGPAGPLEALYQFGDADDREAPAAALVCHPHPLFGGTMHNKVVYRLARAFRRAALPVLWINFRGVGKSAGRHDEGRGEVDDARAALDWLALRRPGAALWAAGFSFGARVALAAGALDPRVTRLAVAGLTMRAEGAALPASLGGRPLLVVQGEQDEYGAPAAVRTALARYAGARLEVVAGAGHFFEGGLDVLEGLVRAFAEEGLRGLHGGDERTP
jgi:alpha/beta superfamily hydrolase